MKEKLPINDVFPNDYNPNRMKDSEFEGLVNSIEQTGLVYLEKDPILVRPIDGSLEIVDGEHRWKACQQLKFSEIWVEIEEMSYEDAKRRCVVRNKDRGNLDWFKLSRIFNEEWDSYGKNGLTQDQIGQDYGFSRSTVADILPIYDRLKDCVDTSTLFSNREMMFFARIKHQRFRKAIIKYLLDYPKPSFWLENKVRLCNRLSEYLEEKQKELNLQLEEKDYEVIITTLIKQDLEESVRNAIDELLGKPLCYIPEVIESDAYTTLRKIKRESVSLVVTSPPYGSLKDYEIEGQITAHESYEDYLERLNEVWKQCKRALVEGGRICINIGDEMLPTKPPYPHRVRPIHADIIKQFEKLEMDFMGSIIWQKSKTRQPSGGGAVIGSYPYPTEVLLEYDYEFILIFRKPGARPEADPYLKEASKFEKKEWTNLTSSAIWKFPGEKKDTVKHPAPFPLELPDRLIKMFSFKGDFVLDPFVGSGTVLISAMAHGRKSIGIDIVPKFIGFAKQRIVKWKGEQENEFRYIESTNT